jgi:hypothetical protein
MMMKVIVYNKVNTYIIYCMKKTCLRCGENFTKLKSHLQKQNLCEPIYLDISCDTMLQNYDKYFIDYSVKKLNMTHYCKCGKKFKYRSGLSRHKKVCNNQENISEVSEVSEVSNNTTNDNISTNNEINNISNIININGDANININNIDNSVNNNNNNINIALQNYGYEILPDILSFVKMVNKDIIDSQGKNLLQKGFELIHVYTPENRNILIRSEKDGKIESYKNGIWLSEPRCNYESSLVCDTRNKIKTMFVEANNKYQNTQFKNMLKTGECYFDVDMDDLSIRRQFRNLTSVLLNNRKELLEYQKASKKGNVIESTSRNFREIIYSNNNKTIKVI